MNKVFNTLGYAATIGLSAAVTTETTIRTGWRMDPHPMPHQFVSWLDNPLRLKYRDPQTTIGHYGVDPGMTVLDVGCGSGLFTSEMAKMVGPAGTVHAVDLQLPCLDATTKRLSEKALVDRVQLHHAGLNELPLDDNSVDLAVMIALLGELSEPYLALTELKRVVKKNARVAVSEELLDPAYMPERAVREYMAEAGFHYAGRSGNRFCYSLIFYNSHPASSLADQVVDINP